ncbi:MAG: fibronectin type III domain-containing protein [Chitinispirillales bacterium]|jgi:fibronectin type 3 domain-containing protein|nr:fibronectin type III domain-containing protein [Chitinispirillales bacterium]
MKRRPFFNRLAGITAVISAIALALTCSNSNPGGAESNGGCAKAAAPGNVTTEALSTSGIKVTWASVGDANFYTVYRTKTPDGEYLSAGKSFGVTFTDTALTSATTYYYKISATNDCGEGVKSNPVSAATMACSKPATPTNVAAEALSATSIKISWDSIPTAKYYDVYRSPSVDGTYSRIDSTANKTYTNNGLQISNTYYYKVIAKNDCGESEKSNYASATTSACPKPAAPTNVTAEAKSSSSIEVTWDEVATAITYKIYRSTTSTGTYSPVGNTAGKSSTSYTDEGLEMAKTYYYTIVAESECEESAQSIYGFATTANCENKPEAPTNIRAEALSPTEIRVSWDAVIGAKTYSIYTKHDSFDYYLVIGRLTGLSYTVTNRNPSMTYNFKVSATNDCGEGEMSASYATATTLDCDLPILPNPTGITATALSAKSVQITWNIVSEAVSYVVYRGTERYGEYWTVGGRITGTSLTDTTLSSSTTYYYAVKALNSCGETGVLDNVVSVTTMCETPIPVNVAAAAKSSGSIEVTWDAVSGAVSYSVYRTTAQNGAYTKLDNVSGATTYTNSGLSSSTPYYYKVTAKSATCDESRMSAAVTAITQ